MVCILGCNYGTCYGQYANEGHGKRYVQGLIASHHCSKVQPFSTEPFIMSDNPEKKEKLQILAQTPSPLLLHPVIQFTVLFVGSSHPRGCIYHHKKTQMTSEAALTTLCSDPINNVCSMWANVEAAFNVIKYWVRLPNNNLAQKLAWRSRILDLGPDIHLSKIASDLYTHSSLENIAL